MIICNIEGGLGNQLFQYAMGRALSIRLQTSLKLDTSFYRFEPQRTFELHRFCIQASVVTPREEWLFARWKRPRITRGLKRLKLLGIDADLQIFHDMERGYDPRAETLTGHWSVRGYWQSERYFAAIADVLREELVVRTAPAASYRTLIEAMRATSSVALHVRRGDYVTVAKDTHGTCGLDYYARAIETIKQRVSDPHFFIFSDEPEWVKENIRIGDNATYIGRDVPHNDVEDFRLMSHCSHFITANSSFSWWAAWLGENPSKEIIVPGQWFRNSDMITTDLIPRGWTKI
jgi:hypothetical protein